jgi:hypothetical protein
VVWLSCTCCAFLAVIAFSHLQQSWGSEEFEGVERSLRGQSKREEELGLAGCVSRLWLVVEVRLIWDILVLVGVVHIVALLCSDFVRV